MVNRMSYEDESLPATHQPAMDGIAHLLTRSAIAPSKINQQPITAPTSPHALNPIAEKKQKDDKEEVRYEHLV